MSQRYQDIRKTYEEVTDENKGPVTNAFSKSWEISQNTYSIEATEPNVWFISTEQTLPKICANISFHSPVFSHIGTES